MDQSATGKPPFLCRASSLYVCVCFLCLLCVRGSRIATAPLGGRVGHGVHRVDTGRLHTAVGNRHLRVLQQIKRERETERPVWVNWNASGVLFCFFSQWVCVVHSRASWRSCPAGYVWVAQVADSSPGLEVSSLEAQTHSDLWSTQFLSSRGRDRRDNLMTCCCTEVFLIKINKSFKGPSPHSATGWKHCL